MSDLPLHRVSRVMSAPEEADELGKDVPYLEPNLTHPAIVLDENDDVLLIYAPFPGDVAELRNAVRRIPMASTYRGAGIRNLSRTFGRSPKKVMLKREGCQNTTTARDYPEQHDVLVRAAAALKEQFRELLPEQVALDEEVVSQIDNDWKLHPESLWSSGVINLSSALPYHYDRSNFESWSAMPVVRRGIRGGCLNLPAYNLTVECRDGMVVYFPGWKVLHGVTPIKRVQPDAYRYSIVYYALRGMKDCASIAVEAGLARKRRTEREQIMAEKVTEGERDIQ